MSIFSPSSEGGRGGGFPPQSTHCTCILTYVCTYFHMYVRKYVPTYVRTHLRTYVPMYALTYLRTYVPTYIRPYLLEYLHMYVLTTNVHNYLRTYTYIHTSDLICCSLSMKTQHPTCNTGIYAHTHTYNSYTHTYG